jgi:NDP-sugar pyrophosphorylase family protein
MLAVILAGGKGTRLKPFTMTIPKPLLPLGDVPTLEVVLRQLGANGFDRVVITLGHMAPLFIAHFGDGSSYGIQIEYVRESEPLGTAAPLKQLRDPPDDFLVMNGDLLTDLSYLDMVATHRRRGAVATIAVAARQEKVDYGVIEIGPDGAFLDYREKPVIPYCVSMGINVLSARALRHIPPHGKFDMPELMLALHRSGERLHCYRTDCYWQDMGRFDDYTRASEDFVNDPGRFLGNGAQRPEGHGADNRRGRLHRAALPSATRGAPAQSA